MFEINRYLQTLIQQLVIRTSLLAHRSLANSLEPIKTPKGTPCSPLISRFYYSPDTVYPLHPTPHLSLLYWSAANPWVSFNHSTALLVQDSSFHQLPNTKRPRVGSGPRLSASHKAFQIIHRLPRLANKHKADISDIKMQQPGNKLQDFFFLLLMWCKL